MFEDTFGQRLFDSGRSEKWRFYFERKNFFGKAWSDDKKFSGKKAGNKEKIWPETGGQLMVFTSHGFEDFD